MKIEMPYFDTHEYKWSVMTVELVDVAPHLTATFAVNRAPGDARRWVVSNVETGYYVGSSYSRSRKEAIRQARVFLSRITQAVLDRQMERAKATKFAGRIAPYTN